MDRKPLFRSTSFSWWGVAVALSLAACGPKPKSSQLQHDYGAPVRDGAAWNWQGASDADFAEVMAPLFGFKPDSILPPEHALTQRTQFWLDQLDRMLRSRYPQDLTHVPRPRAKVLNIAVPNAFVAPVPVCFDLPVQIGTGAIVAGTTVYADAKTGALESFPDSIKCLKGEAAAVAGFVKSFNAGASACQFTLTGAGLTPNAACKVAEGLTSASRLALLPVASFVTVHTGIIPLMAEDEFVSVLAHELGHYYRSHSTSRAGDYDYFYTQQELGSPHKPTPELDKQELGNAAITGVARLEAADTFVAVSDQTFRSDLYFTIGSLINLIATLEGSPKSCVDAAEQINGSLYREAMGLFPLGGTVSFTQSWAYSVFESSAKQCLAEVTVAELADGWEAIRLISQMPNWPKWQEELPASMKKSLTKLHTATAGRLPVTAPNATGAVAFTTLSQMFKQQDEAAEANLGQMRVKRLGHYTSEQEADDEAAEWVAALGIDPAAGVRSMRKLGKGGKAGLRGEIFSQADCDVLWKKRWLKDDGARLFVPLGNLTDSHHSICYRMFNIEREIEAHALKAAAVSVPKAPGPAWSDLQGMAAGTPSSFEWMGQPALKGLSADFDRCPYAAGFN